MRKQVIQAAIVSSIVLMCAVAPGYSKDEDKKERPRGLPQNLPKREVKAPGGNPGNNNSGNNNPGVKLPQVQPPRRVEQPKVQLPPRGPLGGNNNNNNNNNQPRINNNQPKINNPPKIDLPRREVQPPQSGNQSGRNNPLNQPGINPDLRKRIEGLQPNTAQPQVGNKPILPGNQPGNRPLDNDELRKRLEGLKPNNGQPQVGNKPILPGSQPGTLPGNRPLNNDELRKRLEGLKPNDGQPQVGNKPILPGNQPGNRPLDNDELRKRLDGLKPDAGRPQIGNKPLLPGNQPGNGIVNQGANKPVLGKGFDLSNHLKTEMDKNPKLRERIEGLEGNKGRFPGNDDKNAIGAPGFRPLDGRNPNVGSLGPKIDLKKGTAPLKIDRNNLLDSLKRQPGQGDTSNVLLDLQKQRGPRNDQDLQQMFAKLKDQPQFRRNDKLAGVDLDRVSGQFQHRLDRGDFRQANFNRFVNPQLQRNLAIDSQFALFRRGDVARQLNLNVNLINGGGWRARPIGPVFPNYTRSHFSSWYPGPSWCPQYCWTPQWSPWVRWSFWNWCVPIYDPRPFICRPIIYDPCPPVVYYEYPVWQPLPVVTCGTWVDVPPVVIDSGFDVELLAVRFVDPGHQEENLGPRYRVWIRNNSPAAIGAPFNVALVAANGPQLAGELPQAGTTVPSLDANSTIPVDIRLPLAANRLGRNPDGTAMPFTNLHVLVDSHRDLNENNEANNGAVLDRGTIYPVDPAGFSTDVTAASPGSIVSLAGEGFGPEPGQLLVTVNGETQAAEVHGWYDLGVNFKVPGFNLTEATDAQIIVVRGDSAVSNPVELDLAPQGWLQEAQLPPAPNPGDGPVLPPAP